MLQIAMADRSGSHDQRAIGDGLGNGFELFGAGQHVAAAPTAERAPSNATS
jgi:hypothetical protein